MKLCVFCVRLISAGVVVKNIVVVGSVVIEREYLQSHFV